MSTLGLVSISKSELKVLQIRGEERKMFRDDLERAYEQLNVQGWEMKSLNDTVERLEGSMACLREENRDIRIEMENLKRNKHAGEIKLMMASMKSLIYKEKRRLLKGNGLGGSKRPKLVMSVYEDPGDALEDGDNLVYLFMKCEEASWANDVPEVLRYANLVKETVANERDYEIAKMFNPVHPSWHKWWKRNKHKWNSRKEMAKVSFEDITYWQNKLGRTPESV